MDVTNAINNDDDDNNISLNLPNSVDGNQYICDAKIDLEYVLSHFNLQSSETIKTNNQKPKVWASLSPTTFPRFVMPSQT